jgi:hypothetical protein
VPGLTTTAPTSPLRRKVTVAKGTRGIARRRAVRVPRSRLELGLELLNASLELGDRGYALRQARAKLLYEPSLREDDLDQGAALKPFEVGSNGLFGGLLLEVGHVGA